MIQPSPTLVRAIEVLLKLEVKMSDSRVRAQLNERHAHVATTLTGCVSKIAPSLMLLFSPTRRMSYHDQPSHFTEEALFYVAELGFRLRLGLASPSQPSG